MRFSDAADLSKAHTNPSLLTLGVLLPELYLRRSIESVDVEEDLTDGKPNKNVNLITALRLLDDPKGDIQDSLLPSTF